MNSATDAMVEWTQHAKKNAGTIMVLGVVTIIAGVLAVLMPLVSGLSVAILVGIAFIIGGRRPADGGVPRTVVRPRGAGLHRRGRCACSSA